MPITYYYTNTARANAIRAATHEMALETSFGGATTLNAAVGTSATVDTHVFSTASGVPGRGDMSGTWSHSVSVASATTLTYNGTVKRTNSALSSDESGTASQWLTAATGTGIKTNASHVVSGAKFEVWPTTDRFYIWLWATNTSSMTASTFNVNVNNANSFVTVPWSAGLELGQQATETDTANAGTVSSTPVIKTNSLEGGTDAVVISPANSGGASGDAFTTVSQGSGNTMEYDNAFARGGTLSAKHDCSVGAGNFALLQWNFADINRLYGRVYVRFSANPPATMNMITLNNAAGTLGMRISVTTAGKIRVFNSAGTQVGSDTTNSIALNQWVRIEYHIWIGAATAVDIRLFNTPEAAIGSFTEQVLLGPFSMGTGFGQVQTGVRTLGQGPIWTDDYAIGGIDWHGPAANNITVNGSQATETDAAFTGAVQAFLTVGGSQVTVSHTATAGSLKATQQGGRTLDSTNVVTGDTATFDTGVGSWGTNVLGASISHDAVDDVGVIVPTETTAGNKYVGTGYLPVTEGERYEVSLDMAVSAPNGAFIWVHQFTAGGAFLGFGGTFSTPALLANGFNGRATTNSPAIHPTGTQVVIYVLTDPNTLAESVEIDNVTLRRVVYQPVVETVTAFAGSIIAAGPVGNQVTETDTANVGVANQVLLGGIQPTGSNIVTGDSSTFDTGLGRWNQVQRGTLSHDPGGTKFATNTGTSTGAGFAGTDTAVGQQWAVEPSTYYLYRAGLSKANGITQARLGLHQWDVAGAWLGALAYREGAPNYPSGLDIGIPFEISFKTWPTGEFVNLYVLNNFTVIGQWISWDGIELYKAIHAPIVETTTAFAGMARITTSPPTVATTTSVGAPVVPTPALVLAAAVATTVAFDSGYTSTGTVFPFTADTETWGSVASTVSWDGTVGHNALGSVKVITPGTGTSDVFGQYDDATLGNRTKGSFWLLAPAGQVTFAPYLLFTNASVQLVTFSAAPVTSTGVWQLITVEGTAPPGATRVYPGVIVNDSNVVRTWWIDDVFTEETTAYTKVSTGSTKTVTTVATLSTVGVPTKQTGAGATPIAVATTSAVGVPAVQTGSRVAAAVVATVSRIPFLLAPTPWTPAELTATTEFWLADDCSAVGHGGAVTDWIGRKNGLILTQSDPAKKPNYRDGEVGGQPSLDFPGTALLRYGAAISTSNTGHIFIVYKPTDLQPGGLTYVVSAADESTGLPQLDFAHDDSGDVGVVQITSGGTVNNIRSTTTPLVAGNVAFIELASNGSAWTLRFNGVAVPLDDLLSGTNNGNWFDDLTGIDNFVVGARKTASELAFADGRFGMVHVVDGVLTEADRATLHSWVITKYGIDMPATVGATTVATASSVGAPTPATVTSVSGSQATSTHTAFTGSIEVGGGDTPVVGSQATVTHTAFAGAPHFVKTGTIVAETTTPNAGVKIFTKTGTQVTTTDTAFTGVPRYAKTGAQAAETTTAFTGTVVRTLIGSQATSAQTAFTGTPLYAKTGTITTETDTAFGGSPAFIKLGSQVAETTTTFTGSSFLVINVLGSLGTSTNTAFAGTSDGGAILLLPASDLTDGAWVNQVGSNVDLYNSIDELVPSDTDYIVSPASTDATCQIGLSGITDPAISTGHRVSYRFRAEGEGDVTFTVRLMQGAVEVASWAHVNPGTSFVTVTQNLSGVQADAITDYSDLRLQFEADVT